VIDGRYAESGLATQVLHDPLGRPTARMVFTGATVVGGGVSGGTPLEISAWFYDVDPGTLPDPTITDCADSWRERLSRVETHRVTAGVPELVSRKDYCHDARGRVIAEHRTVGAARYDFSHTYNLLDNVVTTTFPDGDTVTYTYDAAGRLATATSAAVGPILASSKVGADGLPSERTLGSGVVQRFCYQEGSVGRLLRRVATGTTGLDLDCVPDVVTGTRLHDAIYQYTDGDRVAQATTFHQDPLTGWTEHKSIYAYDDVDQLVSESYDSLVPTSTYLFDTIGNLTSKDGVGQTYGNSARTTRRAGPNAIHATANGWRLHYDAVGNVETLEAGGATYRMTYDAANRVRAVRSGATLLSELLYDESGARVRDANSTETTDYAGPYHVSSTSTKTFYPGLGVKVTDTSGTRLYLTVKDPRNSTSLVVGAAGVPIQAVTYDPWGAVRDDNKVSGVWSTDRLYNDKQRQSAFGADLDVFDFGPRLYLADVGRWLGVDSSFADGPNRYAYVRNDPINFRDPNGRVGELVVWTFASALCDACAGYYDSLTIGLTEYGRMQFGLDDDVDQDTWAYTGGARAADVLSGGLSATDDAVGLLFLSTDAYAAGRSRKSSGSGRHLTTQVLSSINPIRRVIREAYEDVLLGRGMPRMEHGRQKVFRAHELKERSNSLDNAWEGSLEFEVPGTNHRILQRPDGKLGYVEDHDYANPKLFPGPWYPDGG
jgi:RHS repeat-associated protein